MQLSGKICCQLALASTLLLQPIDVWLEHSQPTMFGEEDKTHVLGGWSWMASAMRCHSDKNMVEEALVAVLTWSTTQCGWHHIKKFEHQIGH